MAKYILIPIGQKLEPKYFQKLLQATNRGSLGFKDGRTVGQEALLFSHEDDIGTMAGVLMSLLLKGTVVEVFEITGDGKEIKDGKIIDDGYDP